MFECLLMRIEIGLLGFVCNLHFSFPIARIAASGPDKPLARQSAPVPFPFTIVFFSLDLLFCSGILLFAFCRSRNDAAIAWTSRNANKRSLKRLCQTVAILFRMLRDRLLILIPS